MVRDKIEDHVVLFPVAGEIFSRVINNAVRADGPHQFHIPRTANTGNLSAQRLCDLCRKRADASGSAIDQNFLLEAGKIKVPVHIHSSLGVPPFLTTLDSDVRNLEDVLTDPIFFDTTIVLIHGGAPWYETASYLAIKLNVWIDISALGFLRPVPELADILRKYFLFAPEKVLFGTDGSNGPTVPGGAEVQHIVVSRAVRNALYLALSGLVRDGVVTEQQAIQIGRGCFVRTCCDCTAGVIARKCDSIWESPMAAVGLLHQCTPSSTSVAANALIQYSSAPPRFH